MNFKGSNFDASSVNNYNMFVNNNSGCSDQPQESSQFGPQGIFSVPPPFPNYSQMPPPPVPVPPPLASVPPPSQFSFVPPFCLSVPPPPPVPLKIHPKEAMLPSETIYQGRESDSGAQFHSSASFQEISHHVPSFPPSACNVIPFQGFHVPSHQGNTFLMTQRYIKSTPDSEENVDERWVKNWLKDIRKLEEDSGHKEIYKKLLPTSQLKINEVRQKIIEISKILAGLENACKSLSVMYKSLSNDEWSLRCSEIEEKQKRLADLLGQFANDKGFVEAIKNKLAKRTKKREREKRKRDAWKQQKIESSFKRQQLHKDIDRWLENMKDSVERGKRDEELKREADSVLAEVTRRKNEAKKQIALLSALIKLRDARVSAQKAVGKNISQQQTEAFNNVIERLKSLWDKQLKEYSLEEQGLKVMLNEAAAEEKNNEALRKKEILRQWEVVLFGDCKTSEYQPQDINEFLSVRKQWDKFVVGEGTVISSSMPPGWVIPKKASDASWVKFKEESES